VEFAVDLGSGLQADRPLFVTCNRGIPVNNTFGWKSVASCACEIIELFAVVFYVLRAVDEFDTRLVINKKLRQAVVETHVFGRLYMIFPDSRREF
jgi:hypothetical protein